MNSELARKTPANGRRGYLSHPDLPTLLAEVERKSLRGELEAVNGPEFTGEEWRVRVTLLADPVVRKVRPRWFWPAVGVGSLTGFALLGWLLIFLVKAIVTALAALLPWLVLGGILAGFLARPTIHVVQSVVIKR